MVRWAAEADVPDIVHVLARIDGAGVGEDGGGVGSTARVLT
jgi:hypothetical protein